MTYKSTGNLKEYLLDCLFYSVISMIWYRNLLFRCLPGLTYTQSKVALWGMIGISFFVCTFFLNRYMWTGWTVTKALSIPYGVYTVAAYQNTAGSWMPVVFVSASILAIAYMILVLSRKIKNRRKRHASVVLIAIMGIIGANGIFGNNILPSSSPAANDQGTAQTIRNNMDTVLLLQEEEWATLTTQEKLDTLQTVANIEAHYLGLPNELNVGAANLEEDVLACYDDTTYTISIDLNSLETDPVEDVLNSCCHEAYHSYQHRLVDAYNASAEPLQGLRVFQSAAQYRQEFVSYADGGEDYYFQACEVDARNYAEEAVQDYYHRIEEYLQETSAN